MSTATANAGGSGGVDQVSPGPKKKFTGGSVGTATVIPGTFTDSCSTGRTPTSTNKAASNVGTFNRNSKERILLVRPPKQLGADSVSCSSTEGAVDVASRQLPQAPVEYPIGSSIAGIGCFASDDLTAREASFGASESASRAIVPCSIPAVPHVQLQLQQPVDTIDPALLSALRDPRERRNLLRLEQLLVDFMNEKNRGFIQVGGNSSPSHVASGGQNLATTAKIQTSFQRLCLHRLADRFGIARESGAALAAASFPASGPPLASPTSNDTNIQNLTSSGLLLHSSSSIAGSLQSPSGVGNNESRNGSTFVMYPIRLVKTRNSRVPSQLLIDLDLSASGQIGEELSANTSSPALHDITKTMSSSSLDAGKSASGPKGQPPESGKMKIMKRSSTGKSGSNGARSDGGGLKTSGGRSNLRGKKLSDKEKAYAEARARIFAEQGGSGVACQTSGVGQSVVSAERRSSSPTGVRNSNASSLNGSSNNVLDTVNPESNPNVTKKFSVQAGSNPADGKEARETPSTAAVGFINAPLDRAKAGKNSKVNGEHVSKGVPGSGVSKVTWRNRRQEENDPDFQRRRGNISALSSLQYTSTGHHIVATTGGAPVYGITTTDASACFPLHSGQGYSQQRQQYYYGAPYVTASEGPNSTSSTSASSPSRHLSSQQTTHVGATFYGHQQHQVYYHQHPSDTGSSGGSTAPGTSGVYVPSTASPSDINQRQATGGIFNPRSGSSTEGDVAAAAASGAPKSVYHSEFPALR